MVNLGLLWWSSSWEYFCQCRGHGFDPWFGKIPHAMLQWSLDWVALQHYIIFMYTTLYFYFYIHYSMLNTKNFISVHHHTPGSLYSFHLLATTSSPVTTIGNPWTMSGLGCQRSTVKNPHITLQSGFLIEDSTPRDSGNSGLCSAVVCV